MHPEDPKSKKHVLYNNNNIIINGKSGGGVSKTISDW